jgi:hypothetical protein
MRYNRPGKGIYCAIYRSYREIPEDWFFVTDKRSFSIEESRTNEESALPNVEHLYVLVFENNKPVAKAYFQLLRLKKEHLNATMVKGWQFSAWRLFTKLIRPKLLVAGHLFRHDRQFFLYDGELSSFNAYKCYKAAINEALRCSCASAVLIKDMPEDLVNHFQNHSPEYLLLRNDISMEMEIAGEWQTISDYEKALKHKYAQRFRKVRQAWEGLEIKELSCEEVKAHKNELYALYLQVLKHQQVRLGMLSPEFLVLLKDHYPQLKVWAVYEEATMIAFFSAWAGEETFDMFYIGFDYANNARLQLYFNILFFAVEQAIQLRKNKLILGRTALDAKARLGCRARYLHTFLHISNPAVRSLVLRKQANVSSGEGDWEEKHPFKPPKN